MFTVFLLQCICLFLACLSCCLCSSACVFTSVHCFKIFSYWQCHTRAFHHCACVLNPDPLAEIFMYQNTSHCDDIRQELWKYLLSQSVLNAVGSVITLWFVLMLWKSRYNGFYAGLKFYSYSATVSPSPHPSVSM